MKLEELFDLKPEGEEEFIKMTPEDFVTKTKALLKLIDKAYATSWAIDRLKKMNMNLPHAVNAQAIVALLKKVKKFNAFKAGTMGIVLKDFLTMSNLPHQ